MKRVPPEFSRPLPVDRVPAGGSVEKLSADADECAALARRLDVPALHGLTARLVAAPWRGGGLKVSGTLTADLDQISVVSLERFRHRVALPVERYFLASGQHAAEEDDADPIFGGEIDMGEVVAETLALDLDPYPRKPGETFAEQQGDTGADDGPVSPFSSLTKLRLT